MSNSHLAVFRVVRLVRGVGDSAGNQDCNDSGDSDTHLGWFGSWSWKCDGGSERVGPRGGFGCEGRLRCLSGVGDAMREDEGHERGTREKREDFNDGGKKHWRELSLRY
jgi:hypothetical protein